MRNEHLMILARAIAHAKLLADSLANIANGIVPSEAIEFHCEGLLAPPDKGDGSYRWVSLKT